MGNRYLKIETVEIVSGKEIWLQYSARREFISFAGFLNTWSSRYMNTGGMTAITDLLCRTAIDISFTMKK